MCWSHGGVECRCSRPISSQNQTTNLLRLGHGRKTTEALVGLPPLVDPPTVDTPWSHQMRKATGGPPARTPGLASLGEQCIPVALGTKASYGSFNKHFQGCKELTKERVYGRMGWLVAGSRLQIGRKSVKIYVDCRFPFANSSFCCLLLSGQAAFLSNSYSLRHKATTTVLKAQTPYVGTDPEVNPQWRQTPAWECHKLGAGD